MLATEGSVMKQSTKSKVLCETPTPGKKGTRIHEWKYEAVRKALRKVIPRKAPGVLFEDLPELVDQALPAEARQKLGSVPWYTTTVKLHLEVIGEIERIPGSSPQRVRLKK
jgi:hypothetical protein